MRSWERASKPREPGGESPKGTRTATTEKQLRLEWSRERHEEGWQDHERLGIHATRTEETGKCKSQGRRWRKWGDQGMRKESESFFSVYSNTELV
jgi:hypothetical protein